MRIVVAGASGAVGQTLVPQLLARGHEVTGFVHSERGAEIVRQGGAVPVLVDGLDEVSVRAAVVAAHPEAIVHQWTSLAGVKDLRHFADAFAHTNRLRTAGTDHLIAAARETGVRRFVAQSFCGHTWARVGSAIKTEDDPLDPNPPPELRTTIAAIRYLENVVTGAHDIGGVALRYGGFYGPGTSFSPYGDFAVDLRRRRVPLIGRGTGIWSFVHIADVANATVAAVEGEACGVFNVVDDEPAPVHDWLPALAEALGAGPPRRLPLPIARLLLPPHIVQMMTEARGASNTRFKRSFDWQPDWPSWRWGFPKAMAT